MFLKSWIKPGCRVKTAWVQRSEPLLKAGRVQQWCAFSVTYNSQCRGNIQSVSLDCRHIGRYHNHIRFIFLCDRGLKDTLPISCSVWWLIFASLMIDWDGSHLKYSPKPATLIVIRDDKVPPKARLFVVFLCSVPPKKRNPTRRGR